MQLLLILSALLSALTGAMGTRVADVPLHQSATAVQVAARVAAVPARVVRRVIALPGLATLAVAPLARVLAVAPAVPLYASRRRE